MATMLGTHNSGISLADGYGNLDLHFEQYLKWIKWAVRSPLASCGGGHGSWWCSSGVG